jgi:hypothetical protein
MAKPLIASLMFDDDGPTVCTPNCGCCSEMYNASFDGSYFQWDDDDLIAFVEQEERRVAALREDLNDYLSRKDN